MLAALIVMLVFLVIPLAWLVVLAARAPRSWSVRALNLLGSAFCVAFSVYAGGWSLLGWYTRWALLVVAVPLWLVAAARARGASARPRGVADWAAAAAALGLALLLGSSLVQVAPGSLDAGPRPVGVHSPLPRGEYFVLQGGDNEVINHHFQVRAQRHALDIGGSNSAGFRADGLAPAELSRYAIYGAPVHSPCAGEVLIARDGLADQPIGPLGEAGRRTPLGNTVLIHCTSDITIVLAHLKPHSVRVAAGDRVAVGAELGAVGYSGNTTEPHLHLHAVRGKVTDPVSALYDAEPVLLSIDGRVPVRNDRLVTPALRTSGASS